MRLPTSMDHQFLLHLPHPALQTSIVTAVDTGYVLLPHKGSPYFSREVIQCLRIEEGSKRKIKGDLAHLQPEDIGDPLTLDRPKAYQELTYRQAKTPEHRVCGRSRCKAQLEHRHIVPGNF